MRLSSQTIGIRVSNYGERMGNLAGVSEFHWFAGNFMRYAAVGHSANEMPVDSH